LSQRIEDSPQGELRKLAKQKIVAVLTDLMFTVKILDAAKQAGLEPVFVKTEQDALRLAREKPALIILDLNSNGFEPLRLIEQLKSDAALQDITLLGFVSHVQADLKQAAEERGCNLVMPRSAFSHNLPTILAKYAAIPK
jgi:PleD family two-component response regulator